MSSLSSHSRRALVASAAALAATPAISSKAKKKGKGKGKKKPPAPLVFAAIVVTRLDRFSLETMVFLVEIGWVYPAGPDVNGVAMPVEVPVTNIESGLTAVVRDEVRSSLQARGHDVPAERIAVALL